MKKSCEWDYDRFDKPKASQAIRNLCRSCPAYEWCLEWGTTNKEAGIWGGLGEGERALIKKWGRDTRQGPMEPPSLTVADHALVA